MMIKAFVFKLWKWVQELRESPEGEISVSPYYTASDVLRKYNTVQDAINSVRDGEEVRIKLCADMSGLDELTIPGTNVNIAIDGQKLYCLGFSGDIIEVTGTNRFCFMNMTCVDGANIECNGAGAEISLEDCQYIKAYLTLTQSAFAIVYKTSMFAPIGYKAININSDTTTIIGYSRVQGSVGNPAIEFNFAAHNKLKAKFSSIIHGSKSTNSPLSNTTGIDINIDIYSCGMNHTFPPAEFTNIIGSANNTTDPNITF